MGAEPSLLTILEPRRPCRRPKDMNRGLLLLALLLTAGCGERTSTPQAAGDDLLQTAGVVTVLDDGDGPELCLGGVAESLPPQCGGPALVGWDWSDHEGDFEEVRGTRWGDFQVVGTYDGEQLTVIEVVAGEDVEPGPSEPEGPGWTTPCEDMTVVDPTRLGYEDFEAATSAAGRLASVGVSAAKAVVD